MSKVGYGLQDSAWLSFYSFFLGETNAKGPERLLALMNLATAGIGWWWPFSNVVIITPQPTRIYIRNQKLHNEDGPAISYEGLDVFALNGVSFRDEMVRFITTPALELNPSEVLAIKNVEQRAEVIKRVGIDRLFKHLDTKLLEKSNEYELHELKLNPAWRPRKYLLMKNPSVDEVHIEAVHPDCNTIANALNFRNFGKIGDLFEQPTILT